MGDLTEPQAAWTKRCMDRAEEQDRRARQHETAAQAVATAIEEQWHRAEAESASREAAFWRETANRAPELFG